MTLPVLHYIVSKETLLLKLSFYPPSGQRFLSLMRFYIPDIGCHISQGECWYHEPDFDLICSWEKTSLPKGSYHCELVREEDYIQLALAVTIHRSKTEALYRAHLRKQQSLAYLKIVILLALIGTIVLPDL